MTPKVYLSGWPDILEAVGLKNNDTDKNKVLSLNKQYQGPIPKVGRGGKQRVEKAKLLDWWNGLEEKFQASDAALAERVPSSTVPCDSGITRTDGKRFRIALSFPGAKREFVAAVAELLAAEVGRERVLYDKWHEAEFARPRLAEHLPPLYREQSELIAVFLCADYRNSEWCGLEWDAILDLIKKREDDAIMLLRFDDTEIAGLYSTHGYVRIEERPAAEIAEVILTRWRLGGTP